MTNMNYFNKIEIEIMKVLSKEPSKYFSQYAIYRSLYDELEEELNLKDPIEKEKLQFRFSAVLLRLTSIFDDVEVLNKDGILSARLVDEKTDNTYESTDYINITEKPTEKPTKTDDTSMPSEITIIQFIVDEKIEKYYSKVDYEGNTILHSLVKYKDFERFKQLYERPDLSLSVENNKGETPIDLITDFRFSNLFIKKLLNDADDNKIKIYRNNQNIKSIDVEFTDLKKFHNDIVKQHNTTVYVIHILLVSFGVYKYFF